MSWSEVKIHKNTDGHLLRNLPFQELDLVGTGVGKPAKNDGFRMDSLGQSSTGTDGFQTVGLNRPTAPSGHGLQGEDEQALSHQSAEFTPVGIGGPVISPQDRQVTELLTTMAENFAELSRLREEVLTNSTDDMLRLVLAIAEQVIHREVQTDPTIILATLGAALQAAIHSDSYHVKVHPDDLALVLEKKAEFMASISGLKNITMEGDPSVSRGGCLVESELGQVDASIEGQLGELRERLLASEEKES